MDVTLPIHLKVLLVLDLIRSLIHMLIQVMRLDFNKIEAGGELIELLDRKELVDVQGP